MLLNDLTGKIFGTLKVISFKEMKPNSLAVYNCQCNCGILLPVYGGNLTKGNTKSCGVNINCLGIIQTEDSIRRKWRLAVRKRDGCCKKCGTIKYLHSHHIEGPEHSLENGITLCTFCHGKFHGIYTKHSFTRKHLEEFLS
jgi:hypothetical protein